MKAFVVGLGSMGKRRIRCLQALNFNNIAGFDLREDRRKEAQEKYGITVYADAEECITKERPDIFIISVPPDLHHIYMKMAVRNGKHFFVEASVTDTDMALIAAEAKKAGIIAAPSATLLFHPAIQKIGEIIKSGLLGKISNFIYHCGQYLPDWHTYEKVSDYYVSNPVTGGAREIVPFELTWITHLFGFPVKVCGNVRKTINIEGAEEIEDTYNFLLDYSSSLASVTIDVVSRFATRRLLINGDQKQLVWDWNEKSIKVYDSAQAAWNEIAYEMKSAEKGYNPNIGENMYIEELRSFLEASKGKGQFINTLENDHRVLKLLYTIEESDKQASYLGFRP